MQRLVRALFWILLVPSSIFAQDSLIPPSGILTTPAGTCDFTTGVFHFDCIPAYLGYLMKFFVVFSGGALLIGIILGGYKYAIYSATATGKEEGKKQLLGAIVGFVLVILSYLLLDTIIEILT